MTKTQESAAASFYDLAQDYAGVLEGPGDLSYNKAYFDDFAS